MNFHAVYILTIVVSSQRFALPVCKFCKLVLGSPQKTFPSGPCGDVPIVSWNLLREVNKPWVEWWAAHGFMLFDSCRLMQAVATNMNTINPMPPVTLPTTIPSVLSVELVVRSESPSVMNFDVGSKWAVVQELGETVVPRCVIKGSLQLVSGRKAVFPKRENFMVPSVNVILDTTYVCGVSHFELTAHRTCNFRMVQIVKRIGHKRWLQMVTWSSTPWPMLGDCY